MIFHTERSHILEVPFSDCKRVLFSAKTGIPKKLNRNQESKIKFIKIEIDEEQDINR